MRYRCAVLDDYQNAARGMADWESLADAVDVTFFHEPFADRAAAARALQGFHIACLMRERTPFPRALLAQLPDLKLLVTTAMQNASIDLAAAAERGITVCGTEGVMYPSAELTIGLMIDLARNISFESNRMRAGVPWQTTVGIDLNGKTLGLIGLGRIGSRVARAARALDMQVLAWSQNLTPERCAEAGVGYASKEELLRRSDFVSVHLMLGPRSTGVIGAAEFGLMKRSAFFINTARGPIVDEAALVAALSENRIAGAALDVFDVEPLPVDHPLRRLPNALLTPHLGYVTDGNYRIFYPQTVEAIRAFLAGSPVRLIKAG